MQRIRDVAHVVRNEAALAQSRGATTKQRRAGILIRMFLARLTRAAVAAVALMFIWTPVPAVAPVSAAPVASLPQAMRVRIRATVARDLALYGGKTPVPGVLLGIWRGDRSAMVEGIGHAQLSPLRPLELDDYIRIGSNTKTFVVTALLQLIDEKKLALDDPVSRFRLPVHVTGGDKITVRELMQMRSGLVEIFDLPGLQHVAMRPEVPIDKVKWTQAACDAPRLFAPGTKWYYSNTNYMLLGMIIEAVTGDRLAEVLAKRIFTPLGLANTSFPTTSPDMPMPYAHGYTLVNGRWVDQSVLYPPSLAWAAGVMISNVFDMKRWVKAYVSGTTNGAATQRARLACLPTGEPGLSFGLGIGCSAGWYGYTGGLAGYNTAAYYLPHTDTTIIAFVMTQRERAGIGVANFIFRDVARIVTPAHIPYTERPLGKRPECSTAIAKLDDVSHPIASNTLLEPATKEGPTGLSHSCR